MEKRTFSVPQWLNSILISLLLIVASAVFFQNRETQKSVETMQLQIAVLTNTMTNHIEFGNEGMQVVKDNEKRLDVIEQNYMSREDVLRQFELIRDWVDKNYQKK